MNQDTFTPNTNSLKTTSKETETKPTPKQDIPGISQNLNIPDNWISVQTNN